MYNVYIDYIDIFDELKQYLGGYWLIFIYIKIEYDNYYFWFVIFVIRDVYVDFVFFYVFQRMYLIFNFKIGEENGILLFICGGGKQFIVVQLIGGQLYVKFYNGVCQSFLYFVLILKLNDN